MKKIIILVVIWLVAVNLFSLVALNRFNLAPDTAYSWINPLEFSQDKTWDPIPAHAKWDSFWYLDIVENGYSFQGEGQLSNIVFFPLYPLLVWFVSFAVFGNAVLAGWLVSITFLILSAVYLFKLVKEFHPEISPYMSAVFLLIFPTAFFLNAVYTESLFLFLSVASFYYALKKNFVVSAVFGGLASLTRITGVLLIIPLLYEYFKEHRFKQILSARLLSLALVPLGALSFFVFHYVKFGDILLFLKVESWWGISFRINGEHFTFLTDAALSNFLIDIVFVAFAFAMTIFVFKKLRFSYGLYMAATILTALSTGTLMSIGRYILVLFPMYISLASIKNRQVQQAVIFVSILLFALNIILFSNSYWAG